MDPDEIPPGQAFARAVVFARCEACNLEAHLLLAQYLLSGLYCPLCGAALLTPPPDAQERIQRLLACEDRFLQELA